MKFLPVTVYRFSLGDCTNGGISARVTTLYVRHVEGIYTDEEVKPELRFKPEHRGGNYWAIVPEQIPTDGRTIGPMHGGNLAEGDSRFHGQIYRVHDRFETPDDYRALST